MPEPKNTKAEPKAKWEKLTENLLFIINGGKNVMFKVDFTKELGESKSGKSMIIASSKGNKPVVLPDGSTIKVGINVYRSIA